MTRQRRPAEREPAGEPVARGRGGLRPLLRDFRVLGSTGFGGPIATVGYMQRDLVERRGWIDREEFLNGVALGQTMPGPLAAQVTMWVGFLERGARGALAVAVAFIAPSFLFVLGVAVLYVRFSGLPVVQAVFYGVAPGVMAIIAIAAYKLARLTNRRDPRLWAISAALAVVTAVTGAEIAVLFLGAGLLMILVDARPAFLARRRRRGAAAESAPASAVPSPAVTPPAAWPGPDRRWWPTPARLAGVAGAVVGAGVPVGLTAIAGTGTLLALALFFLKTGAFTFGSGLAIVPFLREGVVAQHHWLNSGQFLDAVAMGLITPGPVVITAAFIGYLTAGLAGALVATVAIFIPIYLGVVLPGPWFVRHKDNPQVKAFVKGATAAAAGALSGAVVVLTRQVMVDWIAVAVGVLTLVVLLRFKVKEPYVVLACALVGILLH
jgi:chromate transporter